jgi:hypothetical protein
MVKLLFLARLNPCMRTNSLCVMGLPICEFFCLTPRTHTGTPRMHTGISLYVSVRHQQSFLESRVHQIFSVQMHTRALKKSITVNDCDDTTGNEVNDDGDGATGYDNNDDFDGRRS